MKSLDDRITELVRRYQIVEYVSETEEPSYYFSRFCEGLANVQNESETIREFAYGMKKLIRAHERILDEFYNRFGESYINP